MSPCWLAVLNLIQLATASSYVSSFGIRTGMDLTGAAVTLRLYWEHEVIQCVILPTALYSDYTCFTNSSGTKLLNNTNSVYNNNYYMQIINNDVDGFWVDSVMVTDINDNYYKIENFCISSQILLALQNQYMDQQVTSTNLCDSFNNVQTLNSYKQFSIDLDREIVLVNVYFIDNILSHKNQINAGYISSGNVYKFGIKTGSDGTSATINDVLLTLYWNLQVIQCTIYPSEANKEYLCFMNNSIKSCFNNYNNYDNLYKLHIDNNYVDTLEMESIIIYDELNYYYGVNKFCVDSNASKSGKTLITNNNCSSLSDSYSLFENVCLDNINCNNPFIDIEFSDTLFTKPNSVDNYGIVTSGTVESVLTCSPTSFPTNYPSISPTELPTNNPTVIPSESPSNEPTSDPSSLPTTYMPTLSPTPIATYSSKGNYIYVYVGKISWVEANEYCINRFDTYLATIYNIDENAEAAYLTHVENPKNNVPTNHAWFGLNRFYDIDIWSYIDYGGGEYGYSNWDRDQGEPHAADACANIGESGKWYGTTCTTQQTAAILCNAHSNILATTPSGNYKYVYVGKESWSTANEYCSINFGTTLATITSSEQNKEIAMFASLQFSKYAIIGQYEAWIGLNDLSNNSQWQWVDGTPLSYTNWNPAHSKGVSTSCAYIRHTDGYWYDYYCHVFAQYPFFCNSPNKTSTTTTSSPTYNPSLYPTMMPTEPSPPTQAPTIITTYTSNGNYIYVFLGESIDWIEANEYCVNTFGTTLATINSQQQNSEITYTLNVQYTTTNIGSEHCGYIGFHNYNDAINEDWRWMDGTHTNYTNWATNQPDSTSDRCSYMCFYGTWSSRYCQELLILAIICNSPINTSFPSNYPSSTPTYSPTNIPTKPTLPSSTILTSYSYYNNFVNIYLGKSINWFQANQHCMDNFGTFLATISSSKYNGEAAYLINMQYTRYNVGQYAFIGLNTLHDSTNWGWIDNTKLNYSNWHNENESLSTLKGCAYIGRYGTWYSIDCQLKCIYCSILCNVVKTNQPSPIPTEQINTTIPSLTIITTTKSSVNETKEKHISSKSSTEATETIDSVYVLMIILCILVFLVLIAIICVYCFWKRNRSNVGVLEKTQESVQMQEIDIMEEISPIKVTATYIDGNEEQKNETEPFVE